MENEEIKVSAAQTAEEPEAPPEQAAAKPKKSKKSEEVEKLKAELEQTKEALAQQSDTHQRVLAEYANYKRRTEQEKEQLGQFTKGELLKRLLDSLDNMERALEAEDGESYKTGVDMTFRRFKETLQSLGLEEIPAEGVSFNPEVHNAVMREDADGVEAETVTQVFQKGYKLGDRVLRPAMVKVAN